MANKVASLANYGSYQMNRYNVTGAAMVYRGLVKGGVVVFEGHAVPPEGSHVKIEPLDETRPNPDVMKLRKTLLKFAGSVPDLPADASINLKHYLHGHPKVQE